MVASQIKRGYFSIFCNKQKKVARAQSFFLSLGVGATPLAFTALYLNYYETYFERSIEKGSILLIL